MLQQIRKLDSLYPVKGLCSVHSQNCAERRLLVWKRLKKCFLAALVEKEKYLLSLSWGCKNLPFSCWYVKNREAGGKGESRQSSCRVGWYGLCAVLPWCRASSLQQSKTSLCVAVEHCSMRAACRYSSTEAIKQRLNSVAVKAAVGGRRGARSFYTSLCLLYRG